MTEQENDTMDAIDTDTQEEVPEASRLAELKVEASELRRLVGELQERLSASEEEAVRLRERDDAVARYRGAVLAAAPEVPEDLVAGETVQEVDAALAQAKELVERVRRQLLAQSRAERVPAGAPARHGPDLSVLSPQEKISYALRRGRG